MSTAELHVESLPVTPEPSGSPQAPRRPAAERASTSTPVAGPRPQKQRGFWGRLATAAAPREGLGAAQAETGEWKTKPL